MNSKMRNKEEMVNHYLVNVSKEQNSLSSQEALGSIPTKERKEEERNKKEETRNR